MSNKPTELIRRTRVIELAREFSRYPAGRYKSDGPRTAEHFREDHLRPALEQHYRVDIHLDGTRGYGSSFLEEAFGGLFREGILRVDEVERVRVHSSEDPSLVIEIQRYMRDATRRLEESK